MKGGEVRIFCVIVVSNRFNSKNCTSHREYSYYLPTFLLASIDQLYLGKMGTKLKPEEHLDSEKAMAEGKQRVINGITITTRQVEDADRNQYRMKDENVGKRDISHLIANPNFIAKLYGYRLEADRREMVHKTFVETFEGTKKYHNFTKDVEADKEAAKRYMLELRANEYMYVNQKTLEVTSAEDPDALEFVHFYLRGQSFLYNQIRKMIGSMIQ